MTAEQQRIAELRAQLAAVRAMADEIREQRIYAFSQRCPDWSAEDALAAALEGEIWGVIKRLGRDGLR